MPGSVTTSTEPSGRRHGRLSAVAVLLTFIFAASPSAAADCDDWNTANFFASGTVSDVRACLAAGADPMTRGEADLTSLHFAAMLTEGSRIVEALLDAGADPMARAILGVTPLHTAAMSLGDPVGIGLLLEAGIDPNVRAEMGLTPLHVIGLRAEEASPLHGLLWDMLPDWVGPDSRAGIIVELLVVAGANPMARTVKADTPIHYASLNMSGPKIIEALADAGGDPSARGVGGITPLHYVAGFTRDISMIEVLLKAGADPNARNDDGESPLHAAVTKYPDTMAPTVAMQFDENSAWQQTTDKPEIVGALLAAGADPSARDAEGQTVLHSAVRYTTGPAISEMLLEAGSDIEARDHNDRTPLHMAATYNASPAFIDVLTGAGANVGARASHELTALHYAAANNANPAIIDALIDAGADVDARAANEWTALHVAADLSKAPAVVEALIDAGADPMQLNGEGKNAWDLAQRNSALRGTAIHERLRALVGE